MKKVGSKGESLSLSKRAELSGSNLNRVGTWDGAGREMKPSEEKIATGRD